MITVKVFPVNPLEENCYIVSDETNEACIIDCGCLHEAEWQTINSYIKVNNLKPVQLINTHCHFDHILGTGMAYRDYELKPCMHIEEISLFIDINGQFQTIGCPLLKHHPIPPVGMQIDEGDIITFGNHTLKVLHTPGHTAGGLSFYCKAEKIVFTGDTLFMGSIGRTDFAGGSHQTIMQSLHQKLFTLPSDTIVYPGHGPSTTIGYEMTHNLYA